MQKLRSTTVTLVERSNNNNTKIEPGSGLNHLNKSLTEVGDFFFFLMFAIWPIEPSLPRLDIELS